MARRKARLRSVLVRRIVALARRPDERARREVGTGREVARLARRSRPEPPPAVETESERAEPEAGDRLLQEMPERDPDDSEATPRRSEPRRHRGQTRRPPVRRRDVRNAVRRDEERSRSGSFLSFTIVHLSNYIPNMKHARRDYDR